MHKILGNQKYVFFTIALSWCGGHCTSINICGVWGANTGVWHTYIFNLCYSKNSILYIYIYIYIYFFFKNSKSKIYWVACFMESIGDM